MRRENEMGTRETAHGEKYQHAPSSNGAWIVLHQSLEASGGGRSIASPHYNAGLAHQNH